MSTPTIDRPTHHAAPRARVLRTSLLVIALLMGAALALPGSDAHARGGAHPYFNDGGALRWHTRFANAARDAKAQNKLIFVEAGRRRCPMCRKLCKDVLANRLIRGRVAKVAVGLAAEVDHPERCLSPIIASRFAGARLLPLCWFMTPDGRYVTGFWGKRTVAQFARDLDVAEAALRAAKPAPCTSHATPQPPAPTSPAPKPAPTMTTAPAEAPAPRVVARGCPDGDCEDDACDCPDGNCTYEADKPVVPSFIGPECEKGATAAVPPEQNGPAPRPDAPRAVGTPDGDPIPLPSPEIREGPKSNVTRIRPAAKNQGTWQRAREAAAREQWGKVLKIIGDNPARDPALLRIARQAHQWAHDRLEAALRDVEAGRAAEARKTVDVVKREMDGHAAGEDARRGHEAIEYVEDLGYLSEDSAVRRAVRKRAYARLRGSRWARLFKDAK